MSKPYLVILGTALNPSSKLLTSFGEKRTRQFAFGLERVAELADKFSDFDFAIVDNTITPDFVVPESIKKAMDKIPNLKTVFFLENELATKNKGCGVIAGWKKTIQVANVAGYKYVIYFEPRQLLLNFHFFERLVKSPGNYFRLLVNRVRATTKPKFVQFIFKFVPLYTRQFHVGLFSLSTDLFMEYVGKADLTLMADKKVSLEDDIYRKLKSKDIKSVKKLGLIWHDASIDEYIAY